ncbi:MAG: glycosyltransferase family 4 protein [Desulfovibrio sp.]|nr:glycosyltransferase family 4 protein [Desulfovibrio sp.]
MADWSLILNFGASEGWIGGALYIENLVAALLRLPRAERPRLEVRFLSRDNVDAADRIRTMLSRETPAARRLLEGLAARPGVPGRVGRRLCAWTGPRQRVVFPVFTPGPTPGTPLYWIPDFQHRFLPRFFSEQERAQRDALHARVAASPGVLVVSSAFAREHFQRFHPDARVKVRVWSFCSNLQAADADPQGFERLGLPEKFLYLPNQFWAHKNHLTAFTALRLLRERGVRAPLVCTGYRADPRNPEYFEGLRTFLRDHGLEDQVHILGLIPRATQIEVFRRAVAVLQPSLFEGWSTIIEDARALGRPVVASDFPVHREQLRDYDQAFFFRRQDVENLANVLETVYPNGHSGPDAARERQARAQTADRQRAAAESLLSIAREALTAPR